MTARKINRRELFKQAAATGGAMGLLTTVGGRKVAQAAEKVPTRTLGTTGKDIPILLMGGSQKFDPVYDRMLHRAFKDGMYYIDTAEAYANGQSHVTLAPFIEQVGRENLWLTSKSGLEPSQATPERYYEKVAASMDDLGTDYLDMYFMHGIKDLKVLGPEYIKMGEKMKADGFARHFGFSCHDGNVVDLMNRAAEIGAPGIDAIMFRYNFTMYGNLELNKAMDACKEAGIGLIGMKTQTSVPQDAEEVQNFVSNNFTMHQARLKAAWADDRIDSCVSGINNMNILKENADAAKSTAQLAMEEYMQLHQYAVRTAAFRCQGCNQICESRVEGDTRIADMLRYLMYAECYDDVQEARTLYDNLSPAERDITHDFAIAAEACPQGIDIARRLNDARRVLA